MQMSAALATSRSLHILHARGFIHLNVQAATVALPLGADQMARFFDFSHARRAAGVHTALGPACDINVNALSELHDLALLSPEMVPYGEPKGIVDTLFGKARFSPVLSDALFACGC